MSEQPQFEQPELKGTVVPYLSPSDASAAVEFYKKAFGATEAARMVAEDGKRLMHAHIYINGASIMLSDCFPEYGGGGVETPAGLHTFLAVDDTDAWFKRATDAGCTTVMAPEDMFWGDRYAQVKDPFGYTWAMGCPVKS